MTLSLKEFTRLKGLMARTTSDSDPEALTSIRMANKLLATHGLTWDRVFARTVTVISEISGQPIDPDKEDLEEMFDRAINSVPEKSSFRDTLMSIYLTYQDTGRLSEKQRKVVEDAARRAR